LQKHKCYVQESPGGIMQGTKRKLRIEPRFNRGKIWYLEPKGERTLRELTQSESHRDERLSKS